MSDSPAQKTFHGGPLQLIGIDENGRCKVEDYAASILQQITGKIAVVGVAGLYRTGKSFLMNRLLGLQDGFEIGPTVNPCTKGIWMWGQPVQIAKDYHCIFIDTEGLGSFQRTQSCDMQIFSLCILLSSFFIYNSMGALDDQALDSLSLVLNLTQHIHVKAKNSENKEESSEQSEGDKTEEEGPTKDTDLAPFFPNLLWVIRDFNLQLQDSGGNQITSREYLEHTLKDVNSTGEQATQKNKVRETIRNLFRERDCMTMVRPVADERHLRNIQALPYEALREPFRRQAEDFVQRVYTNLRPKMVGGTPVNGAMLAVMAMEYCNAINNSAVPAIQSAWAQAMSHQLHKNLKEALVKYRSLMNDTAMQALPISANELRDFHKAAKAEALEAFNSVHFDANDNRYQEFRKQFTQKTKQLYRHAEEENINASRVHCERLVKDVFAHVDAVISSDGVTFEQLMTTFQQVRRQYSQHAKGPAKDEVLATSFTDRMAGACGSLWNRLSSEHDKELSG